MKTAYLFPGQGSQFPGMGKDLPAKSPLAKEMFDKANDILGFNIQRIMFEGSEEDLRQTRTTQPAVFIHSVIIARVLELKPDMAAGHSLGELSALCAAGALSFEDGLKLVAIRANAMQKACEARASSMAAVLGIADQKVEELCAEITGKNGSGISQTLVVTANYNAPGQLVISGTSTGINRAIEKLKEAGAKRAIVLNVHGAFHSPLMEPARKELEEGIRNTMFNPPLCPVYQNVSALPETDKEKIKINLINQLTAPVRWTQTIQNMAKDGALRFTEVGPGKVLQGLVKRIVSHAEVSGIETVG